MAPRRQVRPFGAHNSRVSPPQVSLARSRLRRLLTKCVFFLLYILQGRRHVRYGCGCARGSSPTSAYEGRGPRSRGRPRESGYAGRALVLWRRTRGRRWGRGEGRRARGPPARPAARRGHGVPRRNRVAGSLRYEAGLSCPRPRREPRRPRLDRSAPAGVAQSAARGWTPAAERWPLEWRAASEEKAAVASSVNQPRRRGADRRTSSGPGRDGAGSAAETSSLRP